MDIDTTSTGRTTGNSVLEAEVDHVGATQDALEAVYTNITNTLYWIHTAALPEDHPGRPSRADCDLQLGASMPNLRGSIDTLMQSIDSLPDFELDKRQA